ncbi:MAG: UDP-N-acetylmuramoylalanine--D-glutamate ligase [Pseudomonadota bacterium]|jgi:UDP-N-acetylmuramoylalanine--D-glutamate ligase
MSLLGQHVLILGLGDSGLSMACWCARQGARVTVADTRSDPPHWAALQAQYPEVRLVTGELGAHLVEGQDIRAVFKSPGLSPADVAPVWHAAQAMGLWMGTELTLFVQALQDLHEERGYTPQVLAITGTNGKTTVTTLTGQLLQRAGVRTAVAGNIGPTLLDTLTQALEDAPPWVPPAVEEGGEDVKEAEVVAEGADQEASFTTEADDLAATPSHSAAEAIDEDASSEMDTDGALIERATDATALEEPAAQATVDAESAHTQAPLIAPPPPKVDLGLPDVWVLELSSFQLDGVSGFEPSAATILNITEDHLDWHGNLPAYAEAKSRIWGTQGLMVINRDDPRVQAMTPVDEPVRKKNRVQRHWMSFGLGMPMRPGDYGLETVNGMTWLVRAHEADETRKRRRDEEEEIHIQRLMPADALRIRGEHNALNALAALALACSTGSQLAPMLYGLREYTGEPHRVDTVAIVNDVEYIDDSKGTNVGATVAALQGLGRQRRLVVILGGDGKGQDFSPLLEPVRRHARAVLLLGRDAPRLREALASAGVPMTDVQSLPQAVREASQLAQPGDAVLLSPACASLDMFRHYGHRAEVFIQTVQELADEPLSTQEAHA